MTDTSTNDGHDRIRIDKWLWAARFFKTRSLAAQAVEGGRVKLNDERVKPAKTVRSGDRVALQIGGYDWLVTVIGIAERRGSAEVARTLYREDEQAKADRLAALEKRRARFEPEAIAGGRPEKKQRRDLQRLRGY